MSYSKVPPQATDEEVMEWLFRQPSVRTLTEGALNPQTVALILILLSLLIGLVTCYSHSHTLL